MQEQGHLVEALWLQPEQRLLDGQGEHRQRPPEHVVDDRPRALTPEGLEEALEGGPDRGDARVALDQTMVVVHELRGEGGPVDREAHEGQHQTQAETQPQIEPGQRWRSFRGGRGGVVHRWARSHRGPGGRAAQVGASDREPTLSEAGPPSTSRVP